MKIRRVLFFAAGICGLWFIGVISTVPITSERARQAVIGALSSRFDSSVDLETFELRLLPTLRAEGTGLTIRYKGRDDLAPLISIRRFWVTGSLLSVLRRHANHVSVEGLNIQIPPKRDRQRDDDRAKPKGSLKSDFVRSFVIDELESIDARLVITPGKPGKLPKIWDIHRLRMQSVGNQMMPFEALLTNAIPPGEIETAGTFGPWSVDDPGETPLKGSFTFDHADLGVFRGISGILSSKGTFGGVLARIAVDGETDTPDFTVSVGGKPVPLRTQYQATVDGTNGDTILQHIDGQFLNTSLVASGRVVDTTPGVNGRQVELDVSIDEGRIEDVLRLVVKAENPMIGALQLRTTLVLPSGEASVVEKLQLEGLFTLTQASFTDVEVNRKITELSQRGRGKMNVRGGRISSNFAGKFTLKGGRLSLPSVSFDVPGAGVQLAGAYDLQRETIDFRGSLFTDVKVSQMTTGFKSFLLKAVDPFFNRDGGGAAIPIKVTGTRAAPSFGLDAGRMFGRK